MAAETGPQPQAAAAGPREKRGFALFAAVIIIAVIAVLATVVTVTLSGDNDQARIETAADVLHRLVAAIDTVKSSSLGASFAGQVVGGTASMYPGRLSQLTHKLNSAAGSTDKSCANVVFPTANAANWRGPYYLAPIPTTGFNVAPGFFANDLLVRVSGTDLAIQMDNVKLWDAQRLELIVEKKSTGAGPLVTFAATDPTSVRYHLISISGNIC